MTSPLNAVLTLLPNENEGHAPLPEPSFDSGAPLPAPMEMARWRQEADARAEALLTEFDAAIVSGQDAASVAHELIHDFMGWTRQSIQRFDRVTLDRVSKGACTCRRSRPVTAAGRKRN